MGEYNFFEDLLNIYQNSNDWKNQSRLDIALRKHEFEETLNKMPGNENQEAYKASKVLEINPNHDLFKGIKSLKDSDELEDYANLLYDQAMLIQGFSIKDPEAFINLLTKIMVKSIK